MASKGIAPAGPTSCGQARFSLPARAMASLSSLHPLRHSSQFLYLHPSLNPSRDHHHLLGCCPVIWEPLEPLSLFAFPSKPHWTHSGRSLAVVFLWALSCLSPVPCALCFAVNSRGTLQMTCWPQAPVTQSVRLILTIFFRVIQRCHSPIFFRTGSMVAWAEALGCRV